MTVVGAAFRRPTDRGDQLNSSRNSAAMSRRTAGRSTPFPIKTEAAMHPGWLKEPDEYVRDPDVVVHQPVSLLVRGSQHQLG